MKQLRDLPLLRNFFVKVAPLVRLAVSSEVVLLPPRPTRVRVQIDPAVDCNSFEIWQGGREPLFVSDQPTFEVAIRPDLELVVLGRSGKRPVNLKGRCSVVPVGSPTGRVAPQADPARPPELRVAEVQRRFGFAVEAFGSGVPAVLTDEVERVVCGVHYAPAPLLDHLLSVSGANPRWWRVESRSVPVDYAALRDSYAATRRRFAANGPYAGFLEVIQGFLSPRADDHQRQLVITAPAGSVLPKAKSAATGLAGAKPLTVWHWSQLAFAAQLGLAWDEGGQSDYEYPLLLAAAKLRFRHTYYEGATPDDRRFAYAELVVTDPAELESLLRLPGVDVIVEFENPGSGRELRLKILARLRGTEAQIRHTFNSLPRRRELVRGVEGADARHLERVHYAVLPGSPRRLGPTYSLSAAGSWGRFLEVLAGATDAAGVPSEGDIPLGRSLGKGCLVTISSRLTHALLFLGTSGTGKTVRASLTAYLRTPYVLTLHVGRPEQTWTLDLAQKFGGGCTAFEGAEPKSPAEFDAAARQLEEEVIASTAEIVTRSRETDRLVGLPHVVRFESGNFFLYLEYLRLILTHQIEAVGRLAKEKGWPVAVIVDDLVAAAKSASDPSIGGRAPQTATRFREALHTAIDTGRQYGVLILATAHGFSSLAEGYGSGLLQDFPFALRFSSERERAFAVAELWHPPTVDPAAIRDVEADEAGSRRRQSWPSGFRGLVNVELTPEILRLLGVAR